MNRLFASLLSQTGMELDKRQNDGDKKDRRDKRLSQRQSGSFGRLHLEKGAKKGAKPGKGWQKMAGRRQSSLEKSYELVPTALPVAQGNLDSAQAVLCELIDQGGWQEVSSIGRQEDVLSRSNVFCSSFSPEASIRMHQHLAAN